MLNVYISNINKLHDKNMIDSILMNISPFRKEKYDNTKNDELKMQILTAGYLIDEYLKIYGLREKNMIYKLTEAGKPCFENKEDIKFSISHSKDLVGVAFSDREVGLDVQVVRNINDEIYNRVLSDKEKEYVFSAEDNSERLNRFFKYWVMKEAILKRDGIGLVSNMQDVHNDYCIVGTLDSSNTKGLISKNETYYYCINNAFDKEMTINIL